MCPKLGSVEQDLQHINKIGTCPKCHENVGNLGHVVFIFFLHTTNIFIVFS